MRIFIKRFWGFGANWPVITFGQKGSLDSLLEQSNPGDLMAFVGTMGPETAPNEQGKLLGLAEFGRKPMHSRTALSPEVFKAAPKRADGDIKWPHAIAMTRAWKFIDLPLPKMTDVIGRQLPMSAMSNAVPLSKEEQIRVLELPREEFDVAATLAVWHEREEIAYLKGVGGTMGPIPSSFTAKMKRDALQPAVTYAFRFGTKNVWKIGWAHNLDDRLADVNKHVPHEALNGLQWSRYLKQEWASAQQAYDMEQIILNAFDKTVRFGERVHCADNDLQSIWLKAKKMV
jgi:hypothetical protein